MLVIEDDKPEVKMQSLDTVAENGRNFTTAEFERAKAARTPHHNAGAPGTERFKGMLRTNWMTDCPVLEKDIDMATEIWGPDVAYLKGKMMRKKPRKFVEEAVQMPPEMSVQMREAIAHIDNPNVSGKVFLSSITKPIFYRDAAMMKDKTADSLHKAVDELTRKSNGAGCTITMTRCDGQFKVLMDDAQDKMNIKMDHSDAGAHESTAEQNNGVIEEH